MYFTVSPHVPIYGETTWCYRDSRLLCSRDGNRKHEERSRESKRSAWSCVYANLSHVVRATRSCGSPGVCERPQNTHLPGTACPVPEPLCASIRCQSHDEVQGQWGAGGCGSVQTFRTQAVSLVQAARPGDAAWLKEGGRGQDCLRCARRSQRAQPGARGPEDGLSSGSTVGTRAAVSRHLRA